MHMGGLAGDEVPAILQRGERVIPKGGSMGHTFNQKFYVGGNVTKADLVATAAAARTGTLAALAEVKRRDPNGVFG
jgi:beta-lactamase class A